MLLYAKKWLIWRFLKIYILSKLILQSSENSPIKHQQGGIVQDSYSDEIFLKNFEKKNCIKKIRFY
jgi:hypothetical protein